MPTEVKMPQMGESIYEGTVTKWLKKEGDAVKKDEPLYELSTDKVDTEIPSPISGTLQKIVVQAGQKVPIHTVVAMVDEDGKGGAAAPAAPAKAEKPTAAPEPPKPAKPAAPPPPPPKAEAAPAPPADAERLFASPLVRKMARDEGIELSQLQGSGGGGRITKEDVVAYLESRKGGAPAAPSKPAPAPASAPGGATAGKPAPIGSVPMTPMRVKIAEHMVRSKATSAHVHTVFEVDLSKIAAVREKEKDDYERVHATKLTYTHFFAAAAVRALREFPVVNSSVEGTNIVYKKEINLG